MNFRSCTDKDKEFFLSFISPDRVSSGISVRELNSRDESLHTSKLPDLVIFPINSREISKILKYCNKENISVTPRGAGTSLEGNALPIYGGIVLNFELMNKVLQIFEKDHQIQIQPGIIYRDLNKFLKSYGLFFPPDPGANATIGGMIGNNASGIRSIKYGATKDYVLSLEVVLPDGEIIKTGSRAIKSSSGYDLTRLFCGSEGTLGVITAATLSLKPRLDEFSSALVGFKSIEDATNAVYEIISWGLVPTALEFLHSKIVKIFNKKFNLGLPENNLLFIEYDGWEKHSLEKLIQQTKFICSENNATNFFSGIGRKKRDEIWKIRYDTYEILKQTHYNLDPIILDVAVPISKFPDIVTFAYENSKNLISYPFGHFGSGNLHLLIFADKNNPESWEKVQICNKKIVNYAIKLNGTSTGEHGIGIGKKIFMNIEHQFSLENMKKIKKLFDPNNILNPGKMFDLS